VLVTHGSSESFARFRRGRGLDADVLATRFTGEQPDRDDSEPEEPAADSDGVSTTDDESPETLLPPADGAAAEARAP
jgi:hypothetical protein